MIRKKRKVVGSIHLPNNIKNIVGLKGFKKKVKKIVSLTCLTNKINIYQLLFK